MKSNRRTILIGSAVVTAVVFLSARQGQRPAGTGGPCCILPVGFSVLPSNAWVAVESNNPSSGVTVGASVTNRQQ